MASDGMAILAGQVQLPALHIPERSWQRWLSFLISAGLLTAILLQFDRLGFAKLWLALPTNPSFWIAFVAYYLALPASEWVIYRRLWGIPATGFGALLRKLVSNELLLGYSGELSFYAWARRKMGLATTPFAAIKDVSINSAIAGNVVTLAMIALAWPSMILLHFGPAPREIALSAGILLLISVAALLFKRRLFSLPPADLRFVFGMHMARLAVTTLLSGVIWHSALPDVPLSLWVLLAALQLLVTRLPFVPNKDLVFAGLAMFVVGHDSQVAALIGIVAALILITHVVLGGLLAIFDILDMAEPQ
jgi:hypothetical protein